MKRTVGLIFGGRSVEHEVSLASARTIARGLEAAGHEVIPLGIGPDGGWLAIERAREALHGEEDHLPMGGRPVTSTLSPLLEAEVDVFFPIVHGTWGEDGTLQGFCEILDRPYVGAGVTPSALAMDKAFCKQILHSNGIPVVDYEIVTRAEFDRSESATLEQIRRFTPPLFVKPCVGGSSVGVTRISSYGELADAIRDAFRFDDRLLIERGINGRELECAVIGHHELEASVIGEIVPGKDFYDYADKYIDDGAHLIAPAELSEDLASWLRELAIRAFAAIDGWGMARVDFLVEGDEQVYINEINTLPGFTDISMFPRLWNLSGLPLPELVSRLVEIAIERHTSRTRLDQGIKDWISDLHKD